MPLLPVLSRVWVACREGDALMSHRRDDRDAMSVAQRDYEAAQVHATRALRDVDVSPRDAAVLQLDRASRAS
jgi:hypothetical protein